MRNQFALCRSVTEAAGKLATCSSQWQWQWSVWSLIESYMAFSFGFCMLTSQRQQVPILLDPSFLLSSSSSGGTLEEHSRFHDASPRRTIRCSPQCRLKSKVERFEIALDCSKPGLTRTASWAAPINREAIGDSSTREWSSEAAARAICPNSLRRRCCISEETSC